MTKIDIYSGFLGAGKTTLIKKMIKEAYAGQKLVPQTIAKIRRLRELLDAAGRRSVRIEVDGNVSFENGAKMRAAGADMFVCGTSSVFHAGGSLEDNIARFRLCLETEI